MPVLMKETDSFEGQASILLINLLSSSGLQGCWRLPQLFVWREAQDRLEQVLYA